jgi:hypothetical protein
MLAHIIKLQSDPMLSEAYFVIQIEANLAYESDHHREFLTGAGLRNIVFLSECSNKARTGTWTTPASKDQMQLVMVEAISAQSIAFYDKLHTTEDDGDAMKRVLFRQLENYSSKFNTATGKRSFTGKIGMEQDDLAMVLQMNLLYRRVFWKEHQKYGQFHKHWRV